MSDFDDYYSPDRWQPQQSWSPEPLSVVGESQALDPADVIQSPATTPRGSPIPAPPKRRTYKSRRVPEDKLPLLQLQDWDETEAYNDDPPTCVHYTLEWKVTSNGKQVSKDTEPNLVLCPSAYWQRTLRSQLDRMVGKKIGDTDLVRIDETNVIVSVTGRAERDLTKRFDELDIDWTMIESQLVEWSDLLKHGKKLRVDVTFHYTVSREVDNAQPMVRGGARGRQSVTTRMLALRNAQVRAEDAGEDGTSVWVKTYQKVRCLSSCPQGPYCWCDPEDKKHYRLSTHHLRQLVKYVQDGGTFETHADLPQHIQAELYAEADAAQSRKRKARAVSPSTTAPITINNHFPELSTAQGRSQTALEMDCPNTGKMQESIKSPLVVSGYLDAAVRQYTDWQQSRFEAVELKDEMARACDFVLDHGFTLAHIYQDQDCQALIDSGIKPGIARHFVSDVKLWTKHVQAD